MIRSLTTRAEGAAIVNERTGKLRVGIIDDSRTYRSIVRLLLEADGDIEVVGEAADGAEGIELIERKRPDLVTMDLDMPRLDGVAAIRRIMAERPTRILVVTGRPAQHATLLFEALEFGALDLIVKPSIVDPAGGAAFREMVRTLAKIPVPDGPPEPDSSPTDLELRAPESRVHRAPVTMIGIVGSTGGPRATVAVLKQLGAGFSLPIAVVQHMPEGAEEGYARYLASASALPVEVVREPVEPRPGRVWLAPAGAHLVCRPGRLEPAKEPTGERCPSANVLFRSMAEVHGEGAVAIILSGSKLDGIAGMREVHARGGLTVVENDVSALQNVGPRQAIADGVAVRALSAPLIGAMLFSLGHPQDDLSTIPPAPTSEP